MSAAAEYDKHFAEAERLATGDESAIAEAQVHATLALAAATRIRTEVDATCAHGTTGLCMYCLIPIIEHGMKQMDGRR